MTSKHALIGGAVVSTVLIGGYLAVSKGLFSYLAKQASKNIYNAISYLNDKRKKAMSNKIIFDGKNYNVVSHLLSELKNIEAAKRRLVFDTLPQDLDKLLADIDVALIENSDEGSQYMRDLYHYVLKYISVYPATFINRTIHIQVHNRTVLTLEPRVPSMRETIVFRVNFKKDVY
jgi:hypothetical protein